MLHTCLCHHPAFRITAHFITYDLFVLTHSYLQFRHGLESRSSICPPDVFTSEETAITIYDVLVTLVTLTLTSYYTYVGWGGLNMQLSPQTAHEGLQDLRDTWECTQIAEGIAYGDTGLPVELKALVFELLNSFQAHNLVLLREECHSLQQKNWKPEHSDLIEYWYWFGVKPHTKFVNEDIIGYLVGASRETKNKYVSVWRLS